MITAISLTNSTITLIVDSNTVLSTNSSNPKWKEILQAYTNEDYDLLQKLVNVSQMIALYSNGDLMVCKNTILYKNNPIHGVDVDRIMGFLKEGLPYKPIANYMARKFNNPNKESIEQMYTFLENKQLPITPEGKIIGYKKVDENFYSLHSGTEPLLRGMRNSNGQILNSVGQTIKMDRNFVNSNRDIGCSNGLHVGSLEFVKNRYHAGQGKIVLVEVDPADVVSIPSDENCMKMRCCEYTVIGEYKGPLSNTIHNIEETKPVEETVKTPVEKKKEKSESPKVDKNDFDKKIRQIVVSSIAEVTGNSIKNSFDFTILSSLDVDSLEGFEIVMFIEEELGINIPNEEIPFQIQSKTIGELIEMVKSLYLNSGGRVENLNVMSNVLQQTSQTPIGSDMYQEHFEEGLKDGKNRKKRKYKEMHLDNLIPSSDIYQKVKGYCYGYRKGRRDYKQI